MLPVRHAVGHRDDHEYGHGLVSGERLKRLRSGENFVDTRIVDSVSVGIDGDAFDEHLEVVAGHRGVRGQRKRFRAVSGIGHFESKHSLARRRADRTCIQRGDGDV